MWIELSFKLSYVEKSDISSIWNAEVFRNATPEQENKSTAWYHCKNQRHDQQRHHLSWWTLPATSEPIITHEILRIDADTFELHKNPVQSLLLI